MNFIITFIGLFVGVSAFAAPKPAEWFPPLLTLPQIEQRLAADQTRSQIIDSIPYQVELLNMPRSGGLREYVVLVVPKADLESPITNGVYWRFEDESEVFLRSEDLPLPGNRIDQHALEIK